MSEPTKCCGNCKHWMITDPSGFMTIAEDGDMRFCGKPIEDSEGLKVGLSHAAHTCDQHEAAKELEDA